MNLVFIGPPASGKGTQAKLIATELSIPHISTGDLLRNSQGELNEKIQDHMNKGELVPDKLILEILKERLKNPDTKKGFILDGFPRNVHQARLLNDLVQIDNTIAITLPDEIAINRITNRITCENCGEVYNKITNPSKQENICDKCGTKLSQRTDDSIETIKKRLETYHHETEQILQLENSNPLFINGNQSIENIKKEILEKINL